MLSSQGRFFYLQVHRKIMKLKYEVDTNGLWSHLSNTKKVHYIVHKDQESSIKLKYLLAKITTVCIFLII